MATAAAFTRIVGSASRARSHGSYARRYGRSYANQSTGKQRLFPMMSRKMNHAPRRRHSHGVTVPDEREGSMRRARTLLPPPRTASSTPPAPPPPPEPRALGSGGQLPALFERIKAMYGRRTRRLRDELAPSLFFLLGGFLCGGVVATAIDHLPIGRMGYWSGVTAASLVLISEFISRQVYGSVPRRRRRRFATAVKRWRRTATQARERGEEVPRAPEWSDAEQDAQLPAYIWRVLNWLKVGFWLGIFVDAFKVGS